jgi:hypothetical protein
LLPPPAPPVAIWLSLSAPGVTFCRIAAFTSSVVGQMSLSARHSAAAHPAALQREAVCSAMSLVNFPRMVLLPIFFAVKVPVLDSPSN